MSKIGLISHKKILLKYKGLNLADDIISKKEKKNSRKYMDDLFPQLFLQEAEGLEGLKSSFLLTHNTK